MRLGVREAVARQHPMQQNVPARRAQHQDTGPGRDAVWNTCTRTGSRRDRHRPGGAARRSGIDTGRTPCTNSAVSPVAK